MVILIIFMKSYLFLLIFIIFMCVTDKVCDIFRFLSMDIVGRNTRNLIIIILFYNFYEILVILIIFVKSYLFKFIFIILAK